MFFLVRVGFIGFEAADRKATGRRDSGNQRWMAEKKCNVGRKAMGAKSVIITRDSPGKARQQKNKLVTTGNYLPTIKNYLPTIKKHLPTIRANYLENLRAIGPGRYFCFSKEPKLNGGCQLPRNSEIFQKTAIDASKWSLHHHFLSTDDIDSARECGGGGHHAPVDGIDGKEPASVLSP